MMEYLAVVVLGVAFVLEKATSFFVQRAAARERRELYDRLQAGTLSDYAVNRGTLGDEQVNGRMGEWEKTEVTEGAQRSVEELTGYREEIPDSAFVEALAGFNSLMS